MKNGLPPDVIVNFYDNYVPSLKDGQYTLVMSQALNVNADVTTKDGGDPTQTPSQPQAPGSQTFIVNGPRFVLPPGDVYQLFPPAGSTGSFDQYLPQIVLNQQAVPWERNLDLSNTQLPPNTGANVIPWVALITFAAGELPGPQPPPPVGTQQNPTLTMSVLLNTAVNGTFNGIETAGPPTGTLAPTLVLEDNEDPNQTYCNIIDVPVDKFNALIPSVNDLRYLAHVRQVSLQNKGVVQGQTGWFSSVISNRFAVPPQGTHTQMGNIVHLVSLEGLESFLHAEGPPNVTGYNFVRMISLYSWSYTSQQDPAENFRTLALNLISDASAQGTDFFLKLPVPDPPVATQDNVTAAPVSQRLQQGFVPLSYAMQSGDQTFAWYRGPLSAVPVQRFLASTGPSQPSNPLVPYTTGDAMIFDPVTGIFDQSYATAFQTGRSLALADQTIATSLLNWRKNAHSVVDLILEYMTSPVYNTKMVRDGLMDANGNLTATAITDLSQLLDTNIVSAAFKDFFATEFYQTLAKSVGTKGGFTLQDQTVILQEAVQQKLAEPADLLNLMQQPQIVALLQQLAGLDNLGTLAKALNPGDTQITLSLPGAIEALSAGTGIVVYSQDGTTSVWIMVSADARANATTIAIAANNNTVSIGAGGTLHVQDPNQDAQHVTEWLAATALLYNVPFNNLVAHPALMPAESIRFFYLDQNWTDALLDGALSIGIQSSRDSTFQQLMRDKLYEAVQDVLGDVRDALLGDVQGQTPAVVSPAGFLVRSKGIAGWPGLEVRAWSAADQTNPMKPLRLDTLADDLLLGIYPDVPVKVTFTEPSEGLVFGMEDEGVEMRFVPGVTGCTPQNVGATVNGENPVWLTPQAIATANRTGGLTGPAMNIAGPNGLVHLIEKTLPGAPTLSPASFAVEMVRVPEQLLLTPTPTT